MKDRSALVAIILLLLITLLALGLRLYHLDTQSLWYDEGFSAYLARMELAEITARTAADIQPPLYYYLLHGWIRLFGDGERALRGQSLLFGVLAVPLVYAVARHLFAPLQGRESVAPRTRHGRLSGLLAALLLAVSPLLIWYSQETRMYSLLTFLCLLSSYLLLLVIQAARGWKILALWTAFTLTTVAALYTHYFAFFVLAFQALYLLLVWWKGRFRPRHLVLGGLASGLVAILVYLPWLPNLVTRYGADVSYWPGKLKLHEILLDIALSFAGGESVLESIGIFLALAFGLVFILCIATLLLHASRNSQYPISSAPYPLVFLLLYLFIPPTFILILSYNSPKFNARYVMVSYPAFVLILASGLAALWVQRVGYLSKPIRQTLVALTLVFILAVSAYANHNAYNNPAFARADFRGVARYIRRHIAPDETIVLSSGHMFPVFDYYAPGIERHLLPDSPTLDTTRTLDYSIAADLNDWLAGQGGVWLVQWQDEVVDPAGFLTTMLAEEGEEQPLGQTFAKVGLQHYRLPPDALFSEQPPIDHPVDFYFENQLRLLGYSQTGEQQVTLFWQASQPSDEDYRVALVLRDTAGQNWGQWDGRPTAYFYPTDRWPVGQIVFGRYDLAPLPGTPPGDYGLEVGVYTEADPIGLDLLDQAGAPLGKRAMLGTVSLSVPITTVDQVETPHPGRHDLGPLALLGWDLNRKEAQPGDRLLLTLVWSAESQPQDDYRVQLFVADAEGQMLDASIFPPTNVWHPTSIWEEGQVWRGQAIVRLPIQVQPGEVRLSIQLVDSAGTALGQPLELTTIRALSTDRVFTPPQPQIARSENFGDQISLLGADLAPGPVAPGDTLHLTLFWRALADTDIPYTVFIHLLGPDGQVVSGHDGEPAGGTRPTTSWVPGEFLADPHQLSIPADLTPGEYLVEVGLYDAASPNLPRLPILDEEGRVKTDWVILGPVQIR